MGYNMTRQGDSDQYGVNSFCCDTNADIKKIPTAGLSAGSSLICLEDSSVWMLDTNKEWHKLG